LQQKFFAGAWVLMVSALAAANPLLEPGVSEALARQRAADLTKVRYELTFQIPENSQQPVTGELRLRFRKRTAQDLILDFVPLAAASSNIQDLRWNGAPREADIVNGHLVLRRLPAGEHDLRLRFTASDLALNRQEEFLYTLFVPDRASTAFPCFDQPDLKAIFQVSLNIPAGWNAVSNGAEISRENTGGRQQVHFLATEPISTYLFAFAAGRFAVEEAERGGRHFRFFHRETDKTKLRRNREVIFDLHAAALNWLEDYTGHPYPFRKFDFVLMPSFQFGGMEHPGSIFYRAASLLLDESATEAQHLARASLIAHETAHMWFGDLVTMRWFDDVWTKEVYANFFAAKMVEPSFPKMDHGLRFFLSHYPAAYEIDRTPGTHPIRQNLTNLNDAASLYGAIIYQKAPIVMDQLERILGPETLRDGLREYIRKYAFGNASWPDLITILDARTPFDLAGWSRDWVDTAGRPHLAASKSAQGWRIRSVGRSWPQRFTVLAQGRKEPVALEWKPGSRELPVPDSADAGWIVPAGDAYAYFSLPNEATRDLLQDIGRISPPRARAAAWMTAWDSVVERQIPAESFLEAAIAAIGTEAEELLLNRLLSWTRDAFWLRIPANDRMRWAEKLEAVLGRRMVEAPSNSMRITFFRSYMALALSPGALNRLENIWLGREELPGVKLGEQDQTALALELVLRGVERREFILNQQAARITDPERKERFAFVRRAVSAQPEERREFFAQFAKPAMRSREPWVIEALGYLHHPIRGEEPVQYVKPALALLREIQQSGGIFFPKAWLDANLGNRTEAAAWREVESYLANNKGLPERLQGKVRQSADGLRRAATTDRKPLGRGKN
jgi:aminopeptidase N